MRKQSILKKTFQFGALTFLSRLIAFPRELLQIKLLGVGALSDAFIAAFRLPSFFRKIFAEGALSAALIPSYVQLEKNNKHETANGVMTLAFIFFEGIVLLMCILVFFFPQALLKTIVPGFSPEQLAYATPLVKILFPFLFFMSSSALLASALQAKNYFFAQAFGPVVHNVVYVATLILCLVYHKNAATLATGILISGVFVFLLHIALYFKHHFSFGPITPDVKAEFKHILKKLLPCLLGISALEINLYVDNVISSYLHPGSYTLFYAANRFMQLPLGIFAVAFSTILLPHFSRVVSYAPKRLHFYLLETAKFTTWMVTPTILFICFSAHKLFYHFLPNPQNAQEAATILICLSLGLVFYCFNRVLTTMFYSLHDTWNPTMISLIATGVNVVFGIIGMYFFGSAGLALATTLSGITNTVGFLILLRKRHNFQLHLKSYLLFLGSYGIHLGLSIIFFLGTYMTTCHLLAHTSWYSFFCIRWGYWIFTIPLFLFTMMFLLLLSLRGRGRTNVYFLKK